MKGLLHTRSIAVVFLPALRTTGPSPLTSTNTLHGILREPLLERHTKT
jgi:hypothetical protein